MERDVGGGAEAEFLGRVIGGGAGDVEEVFAAEDGHVRGGVGVRVDDVEDGCLVCVEDGVGTALLVDVEGPEGGGVSEHFVLRVGGMSPI